MRTTLRFWSFLSVLLIFAGMVLAELQREWTSDATAEPVTLSIASSGTLPLDSISVAALDRKGSSVDLALVRGTWVAAGQFVSSLRIRLPRGGEDRVSGISVAIGQQRVDVSGDLFRVSWLRSTPDSTRVIYDSPPSLGARRSRLPGLGGVINWAGDSAVLSRVLVSGVWKTALCSLAIALAFVVFPFSRPAGDPRTADRSSPGKVILLCAAFAILYGIVFFSATELDDTVNPHGDAWEYQAMAVAASQGHGLNRLGGVEPFEAYRFQNAINDSTDYRAACAWWGGRFHSYRTPGYPAFLAGIYTVFGDSPLRAKQAQLCLLILIAAFLPLLGFVTWGTTGLYAGIPAGFLFLDRWYGIASVLYTECLIMFVLFLFAFTFSFYERKRTLARAALLGFVSGVALLVKGDLVFIPVIVILVLLYRSWRKRGALIQAVVYGAMCAVTITPWSLYASRESGQFVVLSTQGSLVLLEGNNELAWTDGIWHPEYVTDSSAFYNRAEIQRLPVPLRVVRFALRHAGRIPAMVSAKLNEAFGHYLYFRLASLLLLARLLMMLGRSEGAARRPGGSLGRLTRYAVAGLCLVAALASIPLMILMLFAAAAIAAWRGTLERIPFPLSFAVLFTNFVLITVMIFGDRRFISVMEPFFMLTGLTFLLSAVLRPLVPGVPVSHGSERGVGTE